MGRDPDQELLASLKDPERFEHVVTAHFPDVYRYVASRVGAAEGEDLAAETFATGFRIRERYDPERGNSRAWLFGIASNLISNRRRSESRRLTAYARTGTFEDVARGEDLAERIDAQNELRIVAAAMIQLDDAHRDALYLVAIARLSDKEAAEALGIPLGTLKSRVSRARTRLRALVAESTPVPDPEASDGLPRHGGEGRTDA